MLLLYLIFVCVISGSYAVDTIDDELNNISDLTELMDKMESGSSDFSNVSISTIAENSEKLLSTIQRSPLISKDMKKSVEERYELWKEYGQKNESVPIDFNRNEDITFHLYTQKHVNDSVELSANDTDTFTEMNATSPTKILIHGSASTSNDMMSLKDEYIKSGKGYNIIMVDWRKAAFCINSTEALNYTIAVAEETAKLIDALADENAVGYVHIIGPNSASHLAGMIGKKTERKVDRITALDPMMVPEILRNSTPVLEKYDANFVDVIHTSIGMTGWADPLGDADFYPNGGKIIQRGCGPVPFGYICSHIRAYEFFLESINSKTGFQAYECSDWEKFKMKECYGNKVALMGEPANSSASGTFYLETRFTSPFAMTHVVGTTGSAVSQMPFSCWIYAVSILIINIVYQRMVVV